MDDCGVLSASKDERPPCVVVQQESADVVLRTGLYGASGPKRFQIIRVYDITRLPQVSPSLLCSAFLLVLARGGCVLCSAGARVVCWVLVL